MRGKAKSPRLAKQQARQRRVRRRLAGGNRAYLTVYRSAKHMYAQLFDPVSGRTLATVSTRSKDVSGGLSSTGNIEAARRVGKAIATAAREKNIDKVVFNRNGFLYHGRVKALAEAAREAGLQL